MSIFKNKFESVKQDWNTPDSLFNKLNSEFKFETDLAASQENTKCPKYYSIQNDSLKQTWSGVCWLNPPYGNKESKIKDWVKKAYESAEADPSLTVVMLIPARTNTKWFHQYVMKASEVRLICGRVKFVGNKHGLPQPLVLVVFKKSENTIFKSFIV